MIRPIDLNILVFRNADYGEVFRFTDDNGLPIDFSGYSGEFQVRRYENAPGEALVSGEVDCSLGGGDVEISLAKELVRSLPEPSVRGGSATFRYDLRLTAPDGITNDWLRGEITVFGGVVR